MAISYKKYVNVSSSFSDADATAVDLTGLVFLPSTAAMKSDSPLKTDFDANEMVKLTATNYTKCFAEPTDGDTDDSCGLYSFCRKYFSYVSPSGGVAATLRIVKMKDSETPSEALTRAIDEGDSFGAFYFIAEHDAAKLKTVATANEGYNNDYRFVLSVSHKLESDADYYTNYGTTSGTTFTPWGNAGLTFTECPYLSMAILSATDYDGTNTATTHEFKTLADETAQVTTDEMKETLDGFHISYYGMTKANGATKSFYQEGFNADGTDTACYDNEMWMKRTIVIELLSLETTVEKIPPTPSGVGMVVNAITNVVNKGLKNGSILPEKTITNSQKAQVIQLSGGDSDAVYKLNQYGYILAADIVTYTENDTTKYKIVYRLIYLKGDAVRMIEGTHNIY